MKGKVKFYVANRGYGFIIGEDKQDYFFHIKNLEQENIVPTQGDELTFNPKKTERGMSAFNIVII